MVSRPILLWIMRVFMGFPLLPCADLLQVQPGTLVIGRIHPEHPGEDGAGFFKAFETPEAEAATMKATQVWPIIEQVPREYSFEIRVK